MTRNTCLTLVMLAAMRRSLWSLNVFDPTPAQRLQTISRWSKPNGVLKFEGKPQNLPLIISTPFLEPYSQ